ncbi:hypothetical protein B7494_g378 [Chlorociboria aeruginascens]|nr:hypothetical protein B7494_g378 [Chlorociboria aeruginascens]
MLTPTNNVDLSTYFQNMSAEEIDQYSYLDNDFPALPDQSLDNQLSQNNPTSSSPLQPSSERYISPPVPAVLINSGIIQGHRPTQSNAIFTPPMPAMARAPSSLGGSRVTPAPLPRQRGADYYHQPVSTWIPGPPVAAPPMMVDEQAYGEFAQSHVPPYFPQQQPAAHSVPPYNLPPQIPQQPYQHQPVRAQNVQHRLNTGTFETTGPPVRGLGQTPPSNPWLRGQSSQVAPPQASADIPNQGHSMLGQHQGPSKQGQYYSGEVNQDTPIPGQYQHPGVDQNMPNQGYGMPSQHLHPSVRTQNSILPRQEYPVLSKNLQLGDVARTTSPRRVVKSSVPPRNSPSINKPRVNTHGQHVFNQPLQPSAPVQNTQQGQKFPQSSPQKAVPNMQLKNMFGSQVGSIRQQPRAHISTPQKSPNSVYGFPPRPDSEKRFNGSSTNVKEGQLEATEATRAFQDRTASATLKNQTPKKRKTDSVGICGQKENSTLEKPELPHSPDDAYYTKKPRYAGPSLSPNGKHDVIPLNEKNVIILDGDDESITPNLSNGVHSTNSSMLITAAVPVLQMALEQVQNIAPHGSFAQNGIQTYEYILWDFIKNLNPKSTGPFATPVFMMSEDTYPRIIEQNAPARNRVHTVTSASHRIEMPDGEMREAFCTVYTRNYEKGFLGMQLNSEGKLVEIQRPDTGYTLFGEEHKGIGPREYIAAVACSDSYNKEYRVEVRVMPLKKQLDGICFDVEPDWEAVVDALKNQVRLLEGEMAKHILASLAHDERINFVSDAVVKDLDEPSMSQPPTVRGQGFPSNAGSRCSPLVAPQQRVHPGSIRYTPQATVPHGNVAQQQSSGVIQSANTGYLQRVPSSHKNGAYSSPYSSPYMQPRTVNENTANMSRPAPVQQQVPLNRVAQEEPAVMRGNGVEGSGFGDRQQITQEEPVSNKQTSPTPAVRQFPSNSSSGRSVGVGLTLPSAPAVQQPCNNDSGPRMVNGLYMPRSPIRNDNIMLNSKLQLSPGKINMAREYVRSVVNNPAPGESNVNSQKSRT